MKICPKCSTNHATDIECPRCRVTKAADDHPRQESHPNLLRGGVPGHKGGPGRPRNELREWHRILHSKILVSLDKEDLDRLPIADRLKILEVTGRIGMKGDDQE